jgi:hypothetical protein
LGFRGASSRLPDEIFNTQYLLSNLNQPAVDRDHHLPLGHTALDEIGRLDFGRLLASIPARKLSPSAGKPENAVMIFSWDVNGFLWKREK